MTGFLDLSLEIRQMIACDIADDLDLQNYRLSCRSANDATEGDGHAFWRMLFVEHYDRASQCLSNIQYKRRYIQRQKRLDVGTRPEKRKSGYERQSLEVMRDLIVDVKSFTTPGKNTSKNMEKLQTFVNATGFLDRVFQKRAHVSTRHDSLILTLQLALAHISLNSALSTPASVTWRFPESQQMAYSPSSTHPIFNDIGQVDVKWALHVVNFFKYHFRREHEQLCAPYEELAECERPQCWSKMLQNGPCKLGKHWKGTYTYVEHSEIDFIRAGGNEEDSMIQDKINGEDAGDAFQDLCLDFSTRKTMQWPATFEKILHSRTKTLRSAKTRAQKRATGSDGTPAGEPISFRFEGKGSDNSEPFHATGWLNPLPPQQGIPGWQRMTMMKYYVEEGDDPSPMFATDESSWWAYEGVVLPGGMIIVGRWWSPNSAVRAQDQYSGPFILWNVDRSIVDND